LHIDVFGVNLETSDDDADFPEIFAAYDFDFIAVVELVSKAHLLGPGACVRQTFLKLKRVGVYEQPEVKIVNGLQDKRAVQVVENVLPRSDVHDGNAEGIGEAAFEVPSSANRERGRIGTREAHNEIRRLNVL